MNYPNPHYINLLTAETAIQATNCTANTHQDTTDSLTQSSVLTWITQIPSPASHSPPSHSPQKRPSITPHSPNPQDHLLQSSYLKRRRSSNSLPSVFLGDRPSLRKRRKVFQEISANMSGNWKIPMTPPGGYGSIISSSDETAGSGQSSVSPSKLASALKPRGNTFNVGEEMDSHGMAFKDDDAYTKYPNFVDKINNIVNPERLSAMKQASARKFQLYLRTFERMNEATFLRIIFPLLMKDGYHVVAERRDLTDMDKELFRDDKMLYRDFIIDEGCIITFDDEFQRTLIPSIYSEPKFESALAKALQKVDGMKNPKPDYVYGISLSKIPQDRYAPRPQNITALLQIAPRMAHPFLIIEGKADSGSSVEAEDQARRGGATLVNAARQLRATVEDLPDIPGPDEQSFVFSITMSPKLLEVWVHWYEGPSATQTFHMNKVSSFLLEGDCKHLGAIRQKLHNIIEWGALNRFNELAPLRASINAYSRRVRNAEISKAQPSPRSPRKRVDPLD